MTYPYKKKYPVSIGFYVSTETNARLLADVKRTEQKMVTVVRQIIEEYYGGGNQDIFKDRIELNNLKKRIALLIKKTGE